MLNKLKDELTSIANDEKAKIYSRFFKTGPGEYGEDDIFIGLTVPEQRAIAKKYYDLSIKDLQKLLSSKIHEHRLTALFILMHKYEKSDEKGKEEIFNFYLKNTKHINNWDLIDLSAHKILGDYILNNQQFKKIIYKFAKSNSLWEKRIAILSTFILIKNNKFEDTLKISEVLLNDRHD